MKKIIAIIIIITFFWHRGNAQTTKCDSLRLGLSESLLKLDSVTVANVALSTQLRDLNKEIEISKNEILAIIKSKEETTKQLMKSHKLLVDQIEMIQKLEAEVKRLSKKNQ